ncbi:hypothetical protein ACHWQZ_G000836 [Mnemiopsis leidyi]
MSSFKGMKGKDDFMKNVDESEYSIEYPDSDTPTLTKLRLMVLTMCLSIFSTNLVSSMCAPFYPRSAAHHGLDSDVTGTILGVYYATTVLASPFMAIFLTKIGQANLLQLGLVLVGTSSLVFGGIDKVDSSLTFGIISFVLRGLQGVGCAATDTAVFAIASSRFTKHLGKVNSYLNSCMGVSFMLGPPVGGILYSWTNFSLPFLLSALLCFVSIVLVNFVFRNLRESKLASDNHVVSTKVVFTKSWHLFSNVRFLCILVTAMFGTACTSFLDPTLSPYLSRQGYNDTAFIGIFYMVRDVAFTLGTPPVGWLIDTWKWNPNGVLLSGAIVAGVGYAIIGVAGVYLPTAITARICIALIFIGVGQAPVFSATLPAMVEEAAALGLKRDDESCGILAALQNFAFYGGLWAGSVVSGAVTYYYGFPICTGIFGGAVVVVALVHANIHVFCRKRITYQSLENLEMLQD